MLEFTIGEKLHSIENVIEFVENIYAATPRKHDSFDSVIISPEDYGFIYKVFNYAIKRSYETSNYKRVQLLEYLSNFKPETEQGKYDIMNDYDAFKSIMYELLKQQDGQYHHIFIILICIINDQHLKPFQSADLLSRLLFFETYLELVRYKFIILQLKNVTDSPKVWIEFSDGLLKNLANQLWITECDMNDCIEYHYRDRYAGDFKVPSRMADKIRVQLMINDYLIIFKKLITTNIDDDALLRFIDETRSENSGQNKKVVLFLEKFNDVNNEWIIKDENPINGYISASPFNNFVKDNTVRCIAARFIDNKDDMVYVIEPSTNKSKAKESSFMKLPNHIIKRIFAKLSNRQLFDILTVNRRLTTIVCEILYYRPYVLTVQHLQKLEVTILKSSINLTKFPYFIYVKRLNFSFFNHLIDHYTLTYMACCRLVERLTLVNCHGVHGNAVAFFIDNLNNNVLTSLDLSGIMNLNDITVMALVNKCSVSLQGLYVPNLNCGKKFLMELIKNCINLKRLRLNNCSQMDNLVACNISNYLNRLVELDLSGCASIGSNSVFRLLMKLANLRDLNLNGCKKLDSKFIISLFDANKKLKKLKNLDIGNLNNFFSFKDSDIKKLVYIAPNLKHLTLSKHKELTDESLQHLSKLSKTLTTLNMGHLIKITDLGIEHLLICSKITYLDLSSCERISSEGLISLSLFKRLKRLGLVKCSQIDDYTLLIFLSKTQAKLERVHLSYCHQLTGFAILELLRRHINIQHLSVSGIPSIRSISPLIRQYSRPSPPNFTSEQRISFAIFSGYKDVNGFQKVLSDSLLDKNISRLFAEGAAEDNLFDAFLKYCKYKDLNFMELLRFNIQELINITIAYDYLINRYDINTINYNEEVIILELKMILDSTNGNNLLNIKSVFEYFNNKVSETNIIIENGSTIKNSSLADFSIMIDVLESKLAKQELTNNNNENFNEEKLTNEEVAILIKDNNQLMTVLKKSLEIWENNLFSYLTIPNQRSSIQQFKRIESNIMLLKILFNNLHIIKGKVERTHIETWMQQIKPILNHILTKFEQLSFISFFKELITLIKSIKSHDFINNWSVIVNLTGNLRERILKFRKEDYYFKMENDKISALQKAKDNFLFDLIELGSLVTGNEKIDIFPGFNL